ncbi:MAG: LysR family transcriptional regulator [Comamonadaceae bacterium]|nr:MAG: LysR family transcriptional regulator [Comamonadaceae bacterium]
MRLNISLMDLSLFVAVYEQQSVTAAAEREHATQSGVSQHIRKLEGALGVPLFRRFKGGMLPTPAADSYYRACVELLRQHEASARDVQQFGGALEGEIAVGLLANITRSALAPALSRFAEQHPNVRVRPIEAPSRLLADRVHAGELDFAIVPDQLARPGLRRTFFLRTPEVLVSSPTSALQHLAPVQLHSLGKLKMLLPSTLNIRRQVFERYFLDNDVQLARSLELDVIFTALAMVEKSDWRVLVPAIMMVDEIQNGRLTVNSLADPSLWFDFSCIEPQRRSMAPAASVFLQFLKADADRLNAVAIQHLRLTPPRRRAVRGTREGGRAKSSRT